MAGMPSIFQETLNRAEKEHQQPLLS